MKLALATVFGLSTLLVTSCSGALDRAADVAEERVLGSFDDPEGRHAIVVHAGIANPENRRAIEAAVLEAASTGAHLRIFDADTLNAASAETLGLPNNGDLSLMAKNGDGRRDEIEENTALILDSLADTQTAGTVSADGVDLFGAASRAIKWVSQGSIDEPRVVTVITGGGVHRTTSVDLLEAHNTGTDPTISELSSVSSISTRISVVGAGLFPGLDPAPASTFTDLVERFWVEWCDVVVVDELSCSVNGAVAR